MNLATVFSRALKDVILIRMEIADAPLNELDATVRDYRHHY